MAWQDEYLCPQIGIENFTWKRLTKFLNKFYFLLRHSLFPHATAAYPLKDLPAFLDSNNDKSFDVVKDIYQSSIARIDKLESKSSNLLSYVTAVFAFLSFFFIQFKDSNILKVFLIISIFLLILSIIISFRCLTIKSISKIFITDVFEMDSSPPTFNYSDSKIKDAYLKSAIFNENIADNTADMLNGARFFLVSSLIVGLTGIFVSLAIGSFSQKVIKIDEKTALITISQELTDIKRTIVKYTDSTSTFYNAQQKLINDSQNNDLIP